VVIGCGGGGNGGEVANGGRDDGRGVDINMRDSGTLVSRVVSDGLS
jgi:hypothetical protein